MSEPAERTVRVNGSDCRVWQKGDGEPVGVLADLGGLNRWTPFLDALAGGRRVIVPALPGFPGATGHDQLDTSLDWIAATLDLLDAAELRGHDLIGASVGGTLAAEVAALSPGSVDRLVLMAPFGLYDDELGVTDVWCQAPAKQLELLAVDRAALLAELAPPEDTNELEWQILQLRASEAAARLLWPTTDTGLIKRLHRIEAPTLILWGAEDRILAPEYARRFATAMPSAEVEILDGAGHRIDVDAAEQAARSILSFLD